jgi:hypothetical protein
MIGSEPTRSGPSPFTFQRAACCSDLVKVKKSVFTPPHSLQTIPCTRDHAMPYYCSHVDFITLSIGLAYRFFRAMQGSRRTICWRISEMLILPLDCHHPLEGRAVAAPG